MKVPFLDILRRRRNSCQRDLWQCADSTAAGRSLPSRPGPPAPLGSPTASPVGAGSCWSMQLVPEAASHELGRGGEAMLFYWRLNLEKRFCLLHFSLGHHSYFLIKFICPQAELVLCLFNFLQDRETVQLCSAARQVWATFHLGEIKGRPAQRRGGQPRYPATPHWCAGNGGVRVCIVEGESLYRQLTEKQSSVKSLLQNLRIGTN